MPTLVDAHYDLGLHLWNRYRRARGLPKPADLDEAERELRKAVELDPARPRSRLVLGQLLAERKRVDEAVDRAPQAAKLAGEIPRTRTTSGSPSGCRAIWKAPRRSSAPPSRATPDTARRGGRWA